MAQNHIWLVERKYETASYSAVVVAPNKNEAMCLCGMAGEAGFKVTNIGTASKDRKPGVVIADVHAADDDEEYGVRQ